MAHPELLREFAKVASGSERDVLAFVRRHGLLGYREAWRFEERDGVAALYRVTDLAKTRPPPGDPLPWMVAHARTTELVMALLDALGKDELAVRGEIEKLKVVGEDNRERVEYTYARGGHLHPSRVDVGAQYPWALSPRAKAQEIVSRILYENLLGITRVVDPYPPVEGPGQEPQLTSGFHAINLLLCVYWHLADAAAGGWVRRCAEPRCGAYFVSKSARANYCPRPMGYLGRKSPCMSRHKSRRHLERAKSSAASGGNGRKSARRPKS